MTRSSRIATAASCALLACAAEVLPDVAPNPRSVTPSWGLQPEETPIVILGDGFRVQPYQDADGRPRVDATFRALLGAAELTGVQWVSEHELRARVPAGLPLGTHDLEVLAPGGRSGTLPAAFTVLRAEATKVVEEPFGDGTSFAFVFGYDGDVFLGPSGDGRGVVRCRPDGTGCASLALSFERDVTGDVFLPDLRTTVSENTVCPSLETLGATPYCDPVSPQTTACWCGPDYESGRGLMGSFALGSPPAEWLVAMGRVEKAGHLNYLYMTRDVTSPLHFSYVDLYTALPASANGESVVSMATLNDRLYVGVQVVNGGLAPLGEAPRLVVLTRTPDPPGLDSTATDAYATTFRQTAMAESGAVTSQVDAMLGFEGRLFVANRKAVLVSRTGFPTGDLDASTQFEDCTPPAPGGWEATSIVKYEAKIDITPADRGVTGLAEWQGRLYLGRNTRPVPPGTLPPVPELWVFTPRHDPDTGDFLGCLPGDWRLVATSFGSATSTALTALFASRSFLYVGLDDAVTGARLFRTAASAPDGETDFRGRAGCIAPCDPVGNFGLGDPSNSRFFDARAIRFDGVDQVWATVGDGSGTLRAYRISE